MQRLTTNCQLYLVLFLNILEDVFYTIYELQIILCTINYKIPGKTFLTTIMELFKNKSYCRM